MPLCAEFCKLTPGLVTSSNEAHVGLMVGRPAGQKKRAVSWRKLTSGGQHNQTPDAPDLGSGPSEISGGSGSVATSQTRTQHQGWPVAKLSARNSASVRRANRSLIWGRLHRASNRADRHILSGHVFAILVL